MFYILRLDNMFCKIFNFLSIVMPKYFIDILMETGLLVKNVSIFGIGLVILGGQLLGWRFFRVNSYFVGFGPFKYTQLLMIYIIMQNWRIGCVD